LTSPAETLGPREDRPARTAGERLGHGGELGAPGGDAAEIALDRASEFGGRLAKPGGWIIAMAAEGIEIDLVQDHRARGNQLFALEAVDLEGARARPVDGCEPRANGVEPPQRPAVVVDVMAHEQALGEPVHELRLEQKRPNRHGFGRNRLTRG
jgi:hypothetical protein